MIRFYFSILFVCLLAVLSLAQSGNLQKVVPPSPNAASLGKYGDIPVGMFTGSANIGLPLYEVKGRELSLPISLNYHTSGIKVEEIASWVGLGWNLDAGGAITRGVRGIPDEGANGYAQPGSTLINEGIAGQPALLVNVLQGFTDSEPDAFSYSVGGKSGKFIFNQTDQKFYSIPQTAMQIIKTDEGWTLTDENGQIYYFNTSEANQSASVCNGVTSSASSATTSSWYITKIVNANRTDSIQFNYATHAYSFYTITSSTRSLLDIEGNHCDSQSSDSDCYTLNQYLQAKRLAEIKSIKGRVVFNVQSTNRCDLLEDKALESIDVYNNKEELIKKITFSYGYFNDSDQPANCGDVNLALSRRLKLKQVSEGSAQTKMSSHQFEYNSTALPSRMSFAQDHWGYYNGATTNLNLIPTTYFREQLTTDPLTMYPGANREANPEVSQAAMLTRIIYPTGGYTDFEYENHRVNTNDLEPLTTLNEVHVEGDGTGTQVLYEKTFTINVPPTNINGMQGGVYADLSVAGITCNWTGNVSTCAILSVSGPVSYPFTQASQNVYLPNGTYTLRANFNSNGVPDTYKEFFMRLLWKEPVLSTLKNLPVGGLRVKKTTSFDGINHETDLIKTYKYTLSSDTSTSSSLLRFKPSYTYPITYKHYCDGGYSIGEACYRIVRSSSSNYPSVTSQGSHVYYNEVTIFDGNNGKIVNRYTSDETYPDVVSDHFPFAPATAYDWKRGLLIESNEYRKSANDYVLLRKTQNYYSFDGSAKESPGLKVGKSVVCSDIDFVPAVVNGIASETYTVPSDMVKLDSTLVTAYENDETLIAVKKFTYSTTHFQLTSSSEEDSDGSRIVSYFKYPPDYPSTGIDTASVSLMELKNRHVLTPLIEKTMWKEEGTPPRILGGTITTYKKLGSMVLPDKVLEAEISTTTSGFSAAEITNGLFITDPSYQQRLQFKAYDTDNGNILNIKYQSDISTSYQWGYFNIYPVAEVTNASPGDFYYEGFEEMTSGTSSTAKTGLKSYTNAFTVNVPGTGSYTLTYWKKTGNGNWEQIEMQISSTVSIGGLDILIDEVRVHPSGARMTTYTYAEGKGMTSATDANGMSTYFFFDAFNRLDYIKDNAGNLTKKFTYHYKEQPEN